MGRGLLSGLVWGSVISIVVLGTISLLSPQTEPELPVAGGPVSVTEDVAVASPPEGTTDPVVDGTQPVAQLEAPVAETTPTPAADPGQAGVPAGQPATEAVSSIDLPAGSEFRKALPETEAAVPTTEGAPEGPVAPEAPARGAEDAVASAMTGAEAPRRPDTPGMSVTAPTPPAAHGSGPGPETVASTTVDAPSSAPGPALPSADGGEAAPAPGLAKGYPPAVRSEVAETAVPAVPVTAAESLTSVANGTNTPAADAETLAGQTPSADATAPMVVAEAPASSAETAKTVPGTTETGVVPDARVAAGGDTAAEAAGTSAPDGTLSGLTPDRTEPSGTESAEQVAALAPEAGGAVVPDMVSPTEEPAQAVSEAPPDVTSASPRVAEATEPVPGNADATEAGRTPPVETDDAVAGTAVAPSGGGFGRPVQPLTERKMAGSRLPQIGVSATPQAPQEEAETAVVANAPKMDVLTRNARPFDNPQGKPLFSIILIDDGQTGLDRAVLRTFSFPVTFAIDPTRSDAQKAAEEFVRAGFEVVALATGLPEGATASDVEVTLGANLARLPQAVAVMDPPENGLGDRRELVEQALQIAAQDGHGVIGWSRGLGPLETADRKGRQPIAMVYRALDADGEKSEVIKRYLDRAAFKAAQDGAVVMVGHNRPETVTALFEWALDGKSGQVALAPISAVLRQP